MTKLFFKDKTTKLFLQLIFLNLFFSILTAITVDKQKIDFGTITEGDVVETTFVIKNDSEPILNLGIRTSCDCITVYPTMAKLFQGKNSIFKLKFFSTGYTGIVEKKVFIQSNDPKTPFITIDILSNVKPKSGNINFNLNNPKTYKKVNEPKNYSLIIPVTIFSSKGCNFCIKLKTEIIPFYEKKFGIKIDAEEFFIDEAQNYELLLKLEQQKRLVLNQIPVIFVGEDVVVGKDDIKKNFVNVLQKYISRGRCEKIVLPQVSQKDVVVKQLKLLPVIIAAIIDSVNPCAFATIIFLLTYLNMILKKKKGEILFIGTTFIFGVFITYFLLGLGMFKFIYQINQIKIISKIVYLIVGIFALYASYEHFIEAIRIKKGVGIADETIKMRLPNKIRWKIYDAITKFFKLKYLLPASFVLAMIITLLELFCTGQVYLPTIMYLVRIPQYQPKAIFYLLLYSIIFVLPLVGIFVLISFGANGDELELCFRDKVYIIKLLMSGLFLFLAISVFMFVF